ncbi:hypothetical protein CBR_g55070 [Chara braunii]|uniref:Uncharacterized protein n=1 Tax=Chara braunii TaxID=69332 RepID=A0A388MCL2_CHABU|nr:hypothetical protein CBR_g55070 [Chara braunii]|eukprot:GBG92301.1 hypothetical protein CBR_g55070 [Chara braunii]
MKDGIVEKGNVSAILNVQWDLCFAALEVEIIPNVIGERLTPSVVAFLDSEEGGRYIGQAAKNQAVKNCGNTVFEVKRLIGRKFDDETVQKDIQLWPFPIVKGPRGEARVHIRTRSVEKDFTPEEISAMLLAELKRQAETYLDAEVTEAVITVPAYFNDAQRQATKDAGEIAGLKVLRIANEPTAAALGYTVHRERLIAFDRERTKTVMVFDLGGGTLDVSIMEIGRGKSTVIALTGDSHLGGVDFDIRLQEHVLKSVPGVAGEGTVAQRRLTRLREKCVTAKHALSTRHFAEIEVPPDNEVTISRALFENICSDLFERCMTLVKEALELSKLGKEQISSVILVGGSTRMPKIPAMLTDFFDGRKPLSSIHADEAVAYGAAVQAAIIAKRCTGSDLQDLVLEEVTPLTLGVNTWTGGGPDTWKMSVLIPKNTPIPANGEDMRTTTCDNQTTMEFCVYEGESPLCKDNHLLGKFTHEGFEPAPRGEARARLVFSVDSDGILHATSTNTVSGRRSFATFTTDKGRLARGEIEQMITFERKFAAGDRAALEKEAAKHRLRQYLTEMKGKMESTGYRLLQNDRSVINRKVTAIEGWLAGSTSGQTSANEFENKKRELEEACEALEGLDLRDRRRGKVGERREDAKGGRGGGGSAEVAAAVGGNALGDFVEEGMPAGGGGGFNEFNDLGMPHGKSESRGDISVGMQAAERIAPTTGVEDDVAGDVHVIGVEAPVQADPMHTFGGRDGAHVDSKLIPREDVRDGHDGDRQETPHTLVVRMAVGLVVPHQAPFLVDPGRRANGGGPVAERRVGKGTCAPPFPTFAPSRERPQIRYVATPHGSLPFGCMTAEELEAHGGMDLTEANRRCFRRPPQAGRLPHVQDLALAYLQEVLSWHPLTAQQGHPH